jgi:site-specific recombinase XerD
VQEVAQLEWQDIDWMRQQLVVREGPGRKGRMVYLSDDTVCALQEYIRAWGVKPEGHGKVFVGSKGKDRRQGMGVRAMQRRMERYARESGVKVSCHCLRHTMATQLLNYGAALVTVQELLGHSQVVSTQRYARVSNNRVRQDYFEGIRRILSKQ